MNQQIDPELLAAFLEEVDAYLPEITAGLVSLKQPPVSDTTCKELHRLVHTTKGAAAMIGLTSLSKFTNKFEDRLEEISESKPSLTAADHEQLEMALDCIKDYIHTLKEGDRKDAELDELTATFWHGSEEPKETPLAATESIPADLLETFLLEAEDHLRQIQTLLPVWSQNRDDRISLQEIRRSVHTLKGSAAMVGFHEVRRLSHRMEDLLDAYYEGTQRPGEETLTLLFNSSDALDDLTFSRLPRHSVDELLSRYDAITGVTSSNNKEPSSHHIAVEEATTNRNSEQFLRVPLPRLDDLVKLISEVVITRAAQEEKMIGFTQLLAELKTSMERMKRLSGKLETEYEASMLTRGRLDLTRASSSEDFDELEMDRYTEFHTLTREVSETTSDLQTISSELGHSLRELESDMARSARYSSEVEEKLMRIRMVPVATLANRLQRTVRNVAEERGKLAEFLLEGGTTEIDKTMLEEMSDALLHILRNAVDHGLETAEQRCEAGKSETGTIRLKAAHDGNQVVLTISDDGKGLDSKRLRETIVGKGYVTEEEALAMKEEELFSFAFFPGLSTAKEVTDISGRGVGLDVVKSKVEKLKGSIHIESVAGQGTTFTIRLPLTLALARAILVETQGEKYAITLDSVRQILRLEPDMVEKQGNDKVLRFNNQSLPLISLSKAIGLKATSETSTRPPVLILATASRQYALIVDKLHGAREIVIKSLGTHLKKVRGVSGATLLGDGTVVLILNPAELGTVDKSLVRKPTLNKADIPAAIRRRKGLQVLVVDDSASIRRIVSTQLMAAGWLVTTARDGLDALEQIHQCSTPPDVVLLDIEMPRMDGYEFLTSLRNIPAYKDLPVVVLSSRTGNKHIRKALNLGANAYQVKPARDEELINTLQRVVRQSEIVMS